MNSTIGSLNVSKFSKSIIVGDFNIDLLDSASASAVDLLSLMNGYGLHQLVTSPTCITSSSSTLIDHWFVDEVQ